MRKHTKLTNLLSAPRARRVSTNTQGLPSTASYIAFARLELACPLNTLYAGGNDDEITCD